MKYRKNISSIFETLLVFQKVSNYNYNFIIKELAIDFLGEFNCLAKNIEKHKTLSVTIEKMEKKLKAISYKL